jgi:hygromycin-B 4-O-kinase
MDADHAFCISELASGATLEGLDPSDMEPLVGDVQATWAAIAAADVSSVGGFGDFDADGRAPAPGWGEVLRTTLDRAAEDLRHAPAVVEAYAGLIDRCPEVRALIHGDFGSNNILADERQIRAVLDWEHAMVGDPLYDIANTYFWATHLPCMQLQAQHFDRTLADLPVYRDRITCYALRIGLEEAHESLRAGDRAMAAWALARCGELLDA